MDETATPVKTVDERIAELHATYLERGMSEVEASYLSKEMVRQEMKASRDARLAAAKPMKDAVDAAQAEFDAIVTNSPEMEAYTAAKAALDAVKNSEIVAPIKAQLDAAKAELKKFYDANSDLKGSRSASGAPRAKGYTGRVQLTKIETGEVSEHKNMFQAWKFVFPEANHGIARKGAENKFAAKGFTFVAMDE